MSLVQYFTKYFAQLFAIISPLAVVALFISTTVPFSKSERIKIAKLSTAIAYFAMLVFALCGRKLFELFGISDASVHIGGGIIILLMGISMLNASVDDEANHGGAIAQDTSAKKKKASILDVSVTPIGIPIICGPCCITAVTMLQGEACGLWQNLTGIAAVTFVSALVYCLLMLCVHGAKWLTPNVLKLSYKLTGIILVMMAAELVITGLKKSGFQDLKPREQVERAHSAANG
ncbi:MAG: MarC family protein [Puniceicoccales bacterium]|jgi:multiple antibiotic resistance protein|nr:MarC family protein [Puniceicoccales bacterium]